MNGLRALGKGSKFRASAGQSWVASWRRRHSRQTLGDNKALNMIFNFLGLEKSSPGGGIVNKGSDTREPVAGLRGTEEGREDKPGKESWRSSGGVLTDTLQWLPLVWKSCRHWGHFSVGGYGDSSRREPASCGTAGDHSSSSSSEGSSWGLVTKCPIGRVQNKKKKKMTSGFVYLHSPTPV